MALSREEFDCSVCRRLLHEPLPIACGHVFCRACLASALRQASACPLCRAPCYLNASSAVPSLLLQHVLRAAYPEEVARRAVESASDAVESAHARLGLFLLPHAPLLPGVPFACVAYEPRYVLLVDRCWENGLMFGVQGTVEERRGVTIKITAVQQRGHCRVLKGVVATRYRLLGAPAAAEGEFGLYSAAVSLVGDEPPDPDAGVPEEEVVQACLAEAAAALSQPAHAEGGEAPPPPQQQQQQQHGARLLAALAPRLEAAHAAATTAAAAAALRDAMSRAVHRLLLALPDGEAAAVHAAFGAPPAPTATPEAVSYWLANALALTPAQRRAAAATVSTLTRLCLCYGVLLTAAATEEARVRVSAAAAGVDADALLAHAAAEAAREGEGGGAGSGAGAASGAAPGAASDAATSLRASLHLAQPRDALAFFSRTGGEGGDDPDADLWEFYPARSGSVNAARRVLSRALRQLARSLSSRGIKELLLFAGVVLAIYLGRKDPGRPFAFMAAY